MASVLLYDDDTHWGEAHSSSSVYVAPSGLAVCLECFLSLLQRNGALASKRERLLAALARCVEQHAEIRDLAVRNGRWLLPRLADEVANCKEADGGRLASLALDIVHAAAAAATPGPGAHAAAQCMNGLLAHSLAFFQRANRPPTAIVALVGECLRVQLRDLVSPELSDALGGEAVSALLAMRAPPIDRAYCKEAINLLVVVWEGRLEAMPCFQEVVSCVAAAAGEGGGDDLQMRSLDLLSSLCASSPFLEVDTDAAALNIWNTALKRSLLSLDVSVQNGGIRLALALARLVSIGCLEEMIRGDLAEHIFEILRPHQLQAGGRAPPPGLVALDLSSLVAVLAQLSVSRQAFLARFRADVCTALLPPALGRGDVGLVRGILGLLATVWDDYRCVLAEGADSNVVGAGDVAIALGACAAVLSRPGTFSGAAVEAAGFAAQVAAWSAKSGHEVPELEPTTAAAAACLLELRAPGGGALSTLGWRYLGAFCALLSAVIEGGRGQLQLVVEVADAVIVPSVLAAVEALLQAPHEAEGCEDPLLSAIRLLEAAASAPPPTGAAFAEKLAAHGWASFLLEDCLRLCPSPAMQAAALDWCCVLASALLGPDVACLVRAGGGSLVGRVARLGVEELSAALGAACAGRGGGKDGEGAAGGDAAAPLVLLFLVSLGPAGSSPAPAARAPAVDSFVRAHGFALQSLEWHWAVFPTLYLHCAREGVASEAAPPSAALALVSVLHGYDPRALARVLEPATPVAMWLWEQRERGLGELCAGVLRSWVEDTAEPCRPNAAAAILRDPGAVDALFSALAGGGGGAPGRNGAGTLIGVLLQGAATDPGVAGSLLERGVLLMACAAPPSPSPLAEVEDEVGVLTLGATCVLAAPGSAGPCLAACGEGWVEGLVSLVASGEGEGGGASDGAMLRRSTAALSLVSCALACPDQAARSCREQLLQSERLWERLQSALTRAPPGSPACGRGGWALESWFRRGREALVGGEAGGGRCCGGCEDGHTVAALQALQLLAAAGGEELEGEGALPAPARAVLASLLPALQAFAACSPAPLRALAASSAGLALLGLRGEGQDWKLPPHDAFLSSAVQMGGSEDPFVREAALECMTHALYGGGDAAASSLARGPWTPALVRTLLRPFGALPAGRFTEAGAELLARLLHLDGADNENGGSGGVRGLFASATLEAIVRCVGQADEISSGMVTFLRSLARAGVFPDSHALRLRGHLQRPHGTALGGSVFPPPQSRGPAHTHGALVFATGGAWSGGASSGSGGGTARAATSAEMRALLQDI